MTELQNNIYKYLKEIDEICRKHGIEYYLAGGTLIGAIRHEGFLLGVGGACDYCRARACRRGNAFDAQRSRTPPQKIQALKPYIR